MPTPTQPNLFSSLESVRNHGVFSSHWLENRLRLEPEWEGLAESATEVLAELEKLWSIQKTRVAKYGDEQGLEQGFIMPVMNALGWKLKYQTHLQGRKPDYALFLTEEELDAALNVGRDSAEFWVPAAVVADAKKWDLPLDKPSKVGSHREYPPEQIEWYLDRSRKPFGVLTNGRVWRLIPRELASHQRRYQTYFEIDLAKILDDWSTGVADRYSTAEDFRTFFLFFGPAGFVERDTRKRLVQRAVEGSSAYRIGVSEGLKWKAFEALRVCIEGFLAHDANDLNPVQTLDLCRENSFIVLCRLLFIMFAEDRQLLPYGRNSAYTNNRSLGKVRDEVADRLDKANVLGTDDFSRNETGLWDDLVNLFKLIDEGHGRYAVPAYNGGLFDEDLHPFLTEKKLPDYYLARVIDNLGRADDPDHPDGGLFRVDYRDLALQHLGGIYEGLLELRPRLAESRMIVCARRNKGVLEEKIVPEADGIPAGYHLTEIAYRKGSIYLETDKQERRAFGSYYTPDNIVDYIVRQTLDPICASLTQDIEREAQAAKARGASHEVEAIEVSFPDRLLAVRVLDPSMGSGHFLLAACQYLAEQLATNPYTPSEPAGGANEAAITYWKRRVIENCLYGVDLNPLAVDLAKLALWLETVSVDRPLTFLDHHLKYGNSLIGARLRNLGALPGEEGLTAVAFAAAFLKKLPALTEPLAAIRDTPSDNIKAVKLKAKLFAEYTAAVKPFNQLADLWTADAAGLAVDGTNYNEAAKAVDKPKLFKPLTAQDWFMEADRFTRTKLHSFHWDLAFPEVFCDTNGEVLSGGFDAIIGNPPYEVLSLKESGIDPTDLKAFVETEPFYRPAIRGKQNLYKLFICRALDVLRDGGRFGFIVPMALLGDDITSDVRKYMAEIGEFETVEGFPQKDNAAKRVFFDAKLSTTVFTFVKGLPAKVRRKFRSRLHPERTIELDSPGLMLTTDEIPLFDPDNFTIPSCSQTDWDLAVRVMKTGRMKRLKEYAEFFQGEVNETNERKKGTLVQSGAGQLVIRGAAICLYVSRPASQGEDLYLNVPAFLTEKGPETKAFHHKYRRIGLQESSPQNNFRRIIAALVEPGEYFNHTVNYCTERSATLDLRYILTILNSLFADWYFRLGSTNAHVSQYQLNNLPCPHFGDTVSSKDDAIAKAAIGHLLAHRPDKALAAIRPLTVTAAFSPVVVDVIVNAVEKIIEAEAGRGEISRSDRSALSPAAQPFQDFIDDVFFLLAGLTAAEVATLKTSYREMKKVK